ncbi:DUF6089 family protein [Mucilaginibacter sp. UR6-11]|uniref:type IX secretion system protein PorG n=1 Tax=Mucilaginibacter sp. UR6-11 TaxID=1435644 RepID=UPI001E2A4738|nr:DUF6089 family protein [Mucilaginibacter sp. UR6-11]MCC8423895.1 DUF6089 family protein [Mucilaginibacter sp. UR6-11]
MFKTLLVILFLVVSLNVRAQTWEIGGFGGGAGYMGDLNQTNPIKVSGLAAGLFVKRNFDGYLSLKLGYTLGRIAGADSTSKNQQARNRNLSFRTLLNEASLTGEFNLMSYVPSVSKNVYTPYIFAGIAYMAYNPQATYRGQTYDLRDYQTEGKAYANTAIAVPFGVGIKYNIAGRFSLAAELGYRTAYTDYLDDVSGVYIDKSKLQPGSVALALSDRSAGQTAATGTQRGDLQPHDTYLFVGFTLSYTFITQKCYY